MERMNGTSVGNCDSDHASQVLTVRQGINLTLTSSETNGTTMRDMPSSRLILIEDFASWILGSMSRILD
jgi:hypothetical protein